MQLAFGTAYLTRLSQRLVGQGSLCSGRIRLRSLDRPRRMGGTGFINEGLRSALQSSLWAWHRLFLVLPILAARMGSWNEAPLRARGSPLLTRGEGMNPVHQREVDGADKGLLACSGCNGDDVCGPQRK